MPVALRIDPNLGRDIRAARKRRGWSLVTLSSMIGPVGDPPKGLRDTQIVRMEQGRRNLTVEEAWRLSDLFPELDVWELMVAAKAVDPDADAPFREAVRREARRRRLGEASGSRRRALVLQAAAEASFDLQRHTNVGLRDRAGQRLAWLGLHNLDHLKVPA